MKVLYPFLLLQLAVLTATAQQTHKHCGADEYAYQLYATHPALRQQMEANRAYLKKFTEEYIAASQDRGGNDSVYTIPVVFHIIHMYGVENVSDEQIMSGLFVLNRNFALAHPDTANIVPDFKPIAANCHIEFKLARLDPSGQCTNGINRIASTFTKVGDHSVKSLIHWDPAKYLNVYVVRSIANLAGHCLMPDQAAAKPEWDGIVIDHNYLGNTGTASEQTSVVMAHEAGHYLNLFHIWGGNNVPGYFYQPVGQQGNCAIGDDVTDTPPTIGWSNCNLSNASCGNTVDNVQNAMDYSYCNWMFTQGQRQRMRAALNSPVASRNNLITPANLAATGVNLTAVCKAAFTPARQTVCVFDTVFFTDNTIGPATTWLWNFGDGATAAQQHPYHVFTQAGNYYVRLTAGNGSSSVTSDSVLIRVNDIAGNTPFFVEGFETVSSMPQARLLEEFDNPRLRFTPVPQGYNSARAAVLRLPDTTASTGKTVLWSEALDMTGTGLPAFSFNYACSQKKLNNDDALEVFISADCGKTWISKGKRTGSNLRTVSAPQQDTAWYPADSLQWRTYSFNLTQAQNVGNFMFRIEYTNYYGNALYIDNINLNESAYTGLPALQHPAIQILPNPTAGVFTVTGHSLPLQLQLRDVNGRLLLTQHSVANGTPILIHHLPAGIYLVQLQNTNTKLLYKLVKM